MQSSYPESGGGEARHIGHVRTSVMHQSVETQKKTFHDDPREIFDRNEALEMLATATAAEGMPLEWILDHARHSEGVRS